MKTVKKIVAIALLLFTVQTISAQYGGGYGGGYGGMNGGMNGGRSGMNNGMGTDRTPKAKKEVPIEESVGKVVAKLKTDLNLDELQVIAITNIMIENAKTQGILMKKETDRSEQIKEFQALSEKTDREIMNYLNKEQKIKYTALTEVRRNQIQDLSKEIRN